MGDGMLVKLVKAVEKAQRNLLKAEHEYDDSLYDDDKAEEVDEKEQALKKAEQDFSEAFKNMNDHE